jgi:hypothetical protein
MKEIIDKMFNNFGTLDVRILTQMHFYAQGFEKKIIGDILLYKMYKIRLKK